VLSENQIKGFDVYLHNCTEGLIPQNLQLQAQKILQSWANGESRENARSRVRVDQCVSAVRAVELPVLVCLRNSCCHVTEVGGDSTVCENRALCFKQNGRHFINVTLQYLGTKILFMPKKNTCRKINNIFLIYLSYYICQSAAETVNFKRNFRHCHSEKHRFKFNPNAYGRN